MTENTPVADVDEALVEEVADLYDDAHDHTCDELRGELVPASVALRAHRAGIRAVLAHLAATGRLVGEGEERVEWGWRDASEGPTMWNDGFPSFKAAEEERGALQPCRLRASRGASDDTPVALPHGPHLDHPRRSHRDAPGSPSRRNCSGSTRPTTSAASSTSGPSPQPDTTGSDWSRCSPTTSGPGPTATSAADPSATRPSRAGQ